jgi:hypothetical protein
VPYPQGENFIRNGRRNGNYGKSRTALGRPQIAGKDEDD